MKNISKKDGDVLNLEKKPWSLKKKFAVGGGILGGLILGGLALLNKNKKDNTETEDEFDEFEDDEEDEDTPGTDV